MQNEKKDWHTIYLILLMFLLIIFTLPYLNYLGFLPESFIKSKLYQNMCVWPYGFIFKIFYVVMVPLATSLLFSIKVSTNLTKEEQSKFKVYYILISIPILIGFIYHSWFSIYNMVFMPLLIFSHLYIASRAFAKLVGDLSDENKRIGINQLPLGDMGLKYMVYDKKKKLVPFHVHNVFQGIMVTGGAGAGKNGSIVDPAIVQWVEMGCSMTIYDYKGNPATLGLLAYNAYRKLIKDPSKFQANNKLRMSKGGKELLIPKFEIVSFDNLHQTCRPNPISPETVKDSLDMKNQIKNFMEGLDKKFAKNPDFWSTSAISLAHGIAERLRKSYPEHCTLPHVILLGTLVDPKVLVEWLAIDNEVKGLVAAHITAISNNAEGQIAGMFSSVQQVLSQLMDESIFWVLGAEPKNQSNLNLNDPLNPKILSISNNPRKSGALSPLISCILTNIMTNINEQGKHPHAFILDEYPTLHLDISNLPATGRSNLISTMAIFQDKSQVEDTYGKESTAKLISNLNTQFYGMNSLPENVRAVADMFGTEKKVDQSYSVSDSGPSFSTRLNKEHIIQIPDIMSQPKGHFAGKVADGEPAFFFTQFGYTDFTKELEWKKEVDLLNYSPTIKAVYDKDPELAKKLFNNLVKLNYARIKTECDMIIAGQINDILYNTSQSITQ